MLFNLVPRASLARNIKRSYNSISVASRKMSSIDCDEVILEEVGNKGIITLNNPKKLNSLNLNMIRKMYPLLKSWETTKSLVIIKGDAKAFCAGGDIITLTEAGKRGESLTADLFKEEYIQNCLIGTYHIPYIALIDGITMGAGVGLSVHGPYRVATERSLFAMPETAIGLNCDVGGSHFLPRLGGNLGIYLALTGDRVKGRDTLRAGVATHLCDSGKLGNLQQDLLSLESPHTDVVKVLDTYTKEATFGNDNEFVLKPYLKQIQKCFAGTTVKKIIKNLEEDGTDWAKKQVSVLRRMSPISLAITLESCLRGQHLTLQECLTMEYRLTQRCCADHDFYEGVRALLIDKDKNPKWKPATIEEVTDDIIKKYFSPLPEGIDLVL